MLPPGPAEAHQHAVAWIDAAGHGHLADRLGHGGVGDLDEAGGQLLRAHAEALLGHARLELGERRLDGLQLELEGEAIRLHAAQKEVDVGQSQLAGARPPGLVAQAVAERPRVGARALRSHGQAKDIEATQRAASRRHGVNPQHRRPYANATHPGLEAALHLAVDDQ